MKTRLFASIEKLNGATNIESLAHNKLFEKKTTKQKIEWFASWLVDFSFDATVRWNLKWKMDFYIDYSNAKFLNETNRIFS